jgi:hypothetical protein
LAGAGSRNAAKRTLEGRLEEHVVGLLLHCGAVSLYLMVVSLGYWRDRFYEIRDRLVL